MNGWHVLSLRCAPRWPHYWRRQWQMYSSSIQRPLTVSSIWSGLMGIRWGVTFTSFTTTASLEIVCSGIPEEFVGKLQCSHQGNLMAESSIIEAGTCGLHVVFKLYCNYGIEWSDGQITVWAESSKIFASLGHALLLARNWKRESWKHLSIGLHTLHVEPFIKHGNPWDVRIPSG